MEFLHGELTEGTNWQFNFKNVDFRSFSPIQNVIMVETHITCWKNPNGNLTCGRKCCLFHTTHFYLHKPGLQSLSFPTHAHYFVFSCIFYFWNSTFPTFQSCPCLNFWSDFPEGEKLLAFSVPVFTLTSHVGPVNSRSGEWNYWCREPNTQIIHIFTHTVFLIVRAQRLY